MKQLTIDQVLEALGDEPKSIGDRLTSLGFTKEEIKDKFSSDVLNTAVYGSSFLKFIQDNKQILADLDRGIPAKELPADFKNPFDGEQRTLAQRLDELGISQKELKGLFADDTLGLNLNGEEFQDFIVQNQDKFLGRLGKLAMKGTKHG
ncbi:hypothetical protein A2W45_01425 [Candidatus Curtissbacteria bacterium RIFCSPHIGHO2_12_41_11]|uniref:Uncharacterized protein n=3 Tax=Candidatus Curtissiibacteriota TaxID=1752717 RepID=A0A1F5HTE5_9BACT|nr:MAG: hypothetical protein UU56_C0008G0017 [Candidatus Curtissbacteria bacterium GW2011_GWA2_41_24]OGD97980.1 MAG: hypothetical protein A2W45_01425 [Candidatus Curtissbacteria bacterium RIFCSPHIGHO2_12_41_11]OGE07432.1 MAG: hypothetical protein A2W70_03505 [Candidatus Curtissbacteria bacterium RIFCSPLOWO2_02_41_11]